MISLVLISFSSFLSAPSLYDRVYLVIYLYYSLDFGKILIPPVPDKLSAFILKVHAERINLNNLFLTYLGMSDQFNLNGSSIICPDCASTKRLGVRYPCMSHPKIDQSSYLSYPESDFLYAFVLSGDKIRLIEFHGSLDDDNIRCSLVVRRLDDSLVYNVLSYCWGDQNSKYTITCNGSYLEVGHNLYMAMRRIRRDNCTELL